MIVDNFGMTYSKREIYTDPFVGNLVLMREHVPNPGDVPCFGHGPIVLREETNDNNDDGWPDGQVEVWFMRFMNLEECYLHICGGLKDRVPTSHLGGYGQPVVIYQDGVKI